MEIELKFDNKLEFPDITMFELNPGPTESENGVQSTMDQTRLYGITAPLVKVNNITIPFNSIISFELRNTQIPTLSITINDQLDIIETFDKPKSDNLVQVQILPPFDDAYKKINMLFFITNYTVIRRTIRINAVYMVPHLYDSIMKAYGKTTTYEFFESIAKELKLGFCSNVAGTNDSRYIYIPNCKYIDQMNTEVTYCGTEQEDFEWWIDYWNNINLVDVQERMETIDEDLTIWAYPHRYVDTESSSVNDPVIQPCMISNHYAFRDNQMYIASYEDLFNPGANIDGTDKIVATYNMDSCEEDTIFLQDGDVTNDIYTKYVYMGENFGEYKYLYSSAYRGMLQQKRSNNRIKVSMFTPQLALMKGHKVDFMWFKTGEMVKGISKADINTNTPAGNIDQTDSTEEDFILDKQISGQYYIEEVNLIFKNNGQAYNWEQELILSRPTDQIEYYDLDNLLIPGSTDDFS